MNFARDGYGVLQMLDLADARCDEFAPQLIVFALIADDLSRQRLTPQLPQRDVPSEFVDEGVTADWCQAMLAPGEHSTDPLLHALNERFETACRNARAIDYGTMSHSFLYNRLFRHDPFIHLPHKSLNQRIDFSDYARDPHCVETIRRLLDRGIPLAFVLLPTYDDLHARSDVMTRQQRQLLLSLERLTSQQVIRLVEQISAADPLEKYFLLPHDSHPSRLGLNLYGDAVDLALKDMIPDK